MWLLALPELPLGGLSNRFWCAPTTMQYFSHGDALPLARDIPIVTPKMGKESSLADSRIPIGLDAYTRRL